MNCSDSLPTSVFRCIIVSMLLTSLAFSVEAAELKTYILLGQSNMEGYGMPAQSRNGKRAHPPIPSRRLADIGRADLDKEQTGVRYTSGGRWSPLNTRGGAAWGSRFGVEVSFGAAMLKYWQANGEREIAILKHANGGSSLIDGYGPNDGRDWDPNDDVDNQYDQFIRRLKESIKHLPEGDTLDFQGVLWMQGESDSAHKEAADQYEAALAKFIARVRKDVGQIVGKDMSRLDFYVAKIADSPVWTHRETIWAAQQAVADADENVHLVDASKLELFVIDGFWCSMIHYTTQGQVDLGEIFAEAITPQPVARVYGPAVAAKSYPVKVSFSEPVEGLAVSDFKVRNGAALDLSGSGSDYQLAVKPSDKGEVTVQLASSAVTDLDGDKQSNPASNVLATRYIPGPTLPIFLDDFHDLKAGPEGATGDGLNKNRADGILGYWEVLSRYQSEIVELDGNAALRIGNAGWANYYALCVQDGKLAEGVTISFMTQDLAPSRGNTGLAGLDEKVAELFEIRWIPSASGEARNSDLAYWDGETERPVFREIDWSRGPCQVELKLTQQSLTIWLDRNRDGKQEPGETSKPICHNSKGTAFKGFHFKHTIPQAANRGMQQLYDDIHVSVGGR